MLSFESDYITGAHERILKRLMETNRESMSGYSKDIYCESAKKKIREACACDDAEIFFIAGGTQTNQLVISTLLATHEGVVAADTGHVSLHEAGAIEYSGHKVLTVPHVDGKIMPEALKEYLKGFYMDGNCEQMVFPGMVYISHPTEYGTLYSAEELRGLRSVCDEYKLPLYLDGARLPYALMSDNTDVTLPMIAELCDVFYIGGTKAGALCGEALVYTRKNMPAHFNTIVKQRGALLAKGRLFGVQFDELFTDGLYFEIGKHAVKLAMRMKRAFLDKGYKLHIDSYTNQQFVILERSEWERLREKVGMSFWENIDENHLVVRLATSFSTTEEDVEELEKLI
ncbi:MAG: aminotransferase class V-fold PLP-dependent enzyme [Ruminococcaceae bacterium]|nr:aminotransferase class V-fold PLP-dependent enzyme [Oscillospiraceae bacterium]